MSSSQKFDLQCPLPLSDYPTVQLAHGGGGTLMNQLIDKMILSVFDNPVLSQKSDAALLSLPVNKIAFTTDSFVVSPLFFPGGDIGSLAVHGTVNDLSTSGARPLYLSVGFVLEEGFSMESLWKIILSLKQAADETGVHIVTGDTKVVQRGKGDGVFINTTGIGIVEHDRKIDPQSIRPGDMLIINGDIGRHGMAIMTAREELGFKGRIESDSAPLNKIVQALLDGHITVHCMRDLTRGGLASALNELAATAKFSFEIDESRIPVDPKVQALCEVLGIDPLHVANEGRMVFIIPENDVANALKIIRNLEHGHDAVCIGKVVDDDSGKVFIKSQIGARRILAMLSGEQLPRIC